MNFIQKYTMDVTESNDIEGIEGRQLQIRSNIPNVKFKIGNSKEDFNTVQVGGSGNFYLDLSEFQGLVFKYFGYDLSEQVSVADYEASNGYYFWYNIVID